jgi:small neutral amino acid transporter SnatA (MarC family)
MDRADRWTAPILILFFVISGAELELSVFSQWAVVLIGMAYIATRSLGKYFGARISAQMTKCNPNIIKYLGITLEAFRIGCGLVLMLSGIDLVRDSGTPKARIVTEGEDDPAVVPLALPCTVGPGTIGTLLVMGSEVTSRSQRIGICAAIAIACILVGLMLYFSHGVARVLKTRGVKILSKLTGMYLVALAAQIMADGVRGFLK